MRKTKENIYKILIYLSVTFTIGFLIAIIFFIFAKGMSQVSFKYLITDYSAVGESSGILPMIQATVYMVLLSILIATPIGILAAIYLQEYAKQGRLVKTIRFATESLAGIPSIVYGLFGGIFFVSFLSMGYSIMAGALTVSIIILPVIIRTTEEALKTVPQSFREASLALGATKFQTLYKVVLPSSISGILSGVILSIGRVVGESAALLFTAGTVAKLATDVFQSARTLTVHSYLLAKETGDIQGAAASGVVLVVLVLVLNTIARIVAKRLRKV